MVSLFVPGAGSSGPIIGIYDTVVFFIQKAKQIFEMISNFLGSLSRDRRGQYRRRGRRMEKGLARGLSLVINFLAALLRLSGITNKIRDAIQKIRGKVDAVLLRVAKWIANQAKALISKGVGAVKGAVGKVVSWWKQRKVVKVGKKQATIDEHRRQSSRGTHHRHGHGIAEYGSAAVAGSARPAEAAGLELAAGRHAHEPSRVARQRLARADVAARGPRWRRHQS